MKIQKKIFYFLLILAMLSQIIMPIVLAANASKPKYVALGDSIAAGYGLNNITSQRYSALIAQEKSFDEINLAKPGMTCKEFYETISTNKSYQTAIQNADVITISIGSNELLKPAIKIIKEATNVTDAESDEDALNKATNNFKTANPINKLTILNKLATGFTSDATKEELEAGVNQYKEYWKKSLSELNSLKKPDATIVVTDFYNPYNLGTLANLLNNMGITNLDSSNLGSIPTISTQNLGKLFEDYISKMNQILIDESNNQSLYKIAQIKSTFDNHNYFGEPKYTNVSIGITDFNLDPHPNVKGHETISKAILPFLKDANIDSSPDNGADQKNNINNPEKKDDDSKADTILDSNNINSEDKNDLTKAKENLPQTGISYFSLSLIVLLTFIGIYSFIMYKKNKI